MGFFRFFYEKLGILLINAFCAVALSVFLKFNGVQSSAVGMILIAWAFVLAALFFVSYFNTSRRCQWMRYQLDGLDQKYLVSEILEKPHTQMELVYYEMLKKACKSMTEEVTRAKEGQKSYKEYVEEWIHEVKSPITAIDLICKNHVDEETKRIHGELKHINYLVEQALYYARSEVVEKDYFVKEIVLEEAVTPAVLENRDGILSKGIKLDIDEMYFKVWTDEKWFTFILNQILSNSVKYCLGGDSRIHIYAERIKDGVVLWIDDNGMGIKPEDLPRVTEKGFTGSDRKNKKSTGLGLYLAKRLSVRLGLSLDVFSVYGEGTRVRIVFPVGSLHQLDLQYCK